MKESYVKIKLTTLVFWLIFIGTLLVYATNAVTNNRNGYYTHRICEVSNGASYDPRSGDGPECEQYGLATEQESRVRTAFRGIGEGLVPAIILSVIGLYLAGLYEDKREKAKHKHPKK